MINEIEYLKMWMTYKGIHDFHDHCSSYDVKGIQYCIGNIMKNHTNSLCMYLIPTKSRD